MNLDRRQMSCESVGQTNFQPVRFSRLARALADAEFVVPKAHVAARLGCPPGAELSTRLTRQIDVAASELADHAETRIEHRCYPMRVEAGRVDVAGRTTFRSVKLARALGPCEYIHVFIVTLGPAVDRFIHRTMKRRSDVGVVVDAAASAAVESLEDRLEQSLAEQLPPQSALSLPFSPGYCDWPVREQQKVFSLLPDRPAGVALSADGMMTPRKSISGVLGVGPVECVTDSCNPCSTCTRRDCPHRRHSYGRSS